MRLSELQPKFLLIEKSNVHHREVDEMEVAHGLMFVCPRCLRMSIERRHSIVCWFDGRLVSEGEIPTWARWSVSGSGYGDLTLDGVVAVRGGCRWRGRVRNGRIVVP